MADGLRYALRNILASPQHPPEESWFFYGGIILTLVYAAAGLLMLHLQNVAEYKELSVACITTGLHLADCHEEALRVAVTTIFSAGLVLIVSPMLLGLMRRDLAASTETGDFSLLIAVVSAGLLAILSAHYIARTYGDAYVSRLGSIEHESVYIALENMLWPVVLQCLVIVHDRRKYLLLLLIMFNVAVVTPYRGVLFAFIIFGLSIPFLWLLVGYFRKNSGGFRWNHGDIAITFLNMIVISMLITGMVQDSENRGMYSDAMNSRISSAEVKKTAAGASVPLTITQHAIQRITFPFYQAVMAEYVTLYTETPDLANEFLTRLHIPNKPTLNQLLYSRLYESMYGQTTFLFYGEGAAYSIAHPFFWCTAALLFFVALFAILRQFSIPSGLLIGLALWRGSMSGLFSILPSLMVQVGLMVVICCFLQKYSRKFSYDIHAPS